MLAALISTVTSVYTFINCSTKELKVGNKMAISETGIMINLSWTTLMFESLSRRLITYASL